MAAPVIVSPAELRGTAIAALEHGRADLALAMARALLARAPSDLLAALLEARALSDLGRGAEAITAARSAWEMARAKGERYDAARIMAGAHAAVGHDLRTAFWLRRALDHAPSPGARAEVLRALRRLRDRAPLALSLGVDIAPSSNINGGSSARETVLFGLPFTLQGASRALPGTRIGLDGRLSYRLPGATATAANVIVVELAAHTHLLSRAARLKAPDARATDFDQIAGYLALRRDWANGAELEAGIGQSFYGGTPAARFARLGAGRELAADAQRVITAGGALRIDEGLGGREEVLRLDAYLRRTAGIGAGGLWSAELRAARSISDAPAQDHAEVAVSLRRRFAPLTDGVFAAMRPQVGIGGSLRYRRQARSLFVQGGRDEIGAALSGELVLGGLERLGFVPAITFDGTLRRSRVDLYDSETYGIGLSLRSVF
ncbi:hypothetical protein [Profundibacterium mesophilum]|uniref:DUF560 domain-containing protein n=1 Tax=Profundibacterium mesophilum KAUST100406-0324 TaxID=1037889 RepID=A0A921NUN1_9RHOB|nr:hypothetical protein [Profundibacterium mesophilum]KAF0676984.1 hypothetical protein PMES_00781 [Profundibacterium mesophilum KAUST100406-0324]